MKCEDVLKILGERVAPVALSDRFCKAYGLYDNSGIIINLNKEITGAVFSLDLSEAAVDMAVKLGYNLIVTHHPAIYGGISCIDILSSSKSRAIAACIASGIGVISMHLNFDTAPQGIDYYLMKGLGGENGKVLSPVEGGGYGRVYDVAPTPIYDYIKKVSAEFKTHRIVCHGESGFEVIKRVASFCGAGCDDGAIAFAKREKAGLFVSSDLKHHELAELAECGIPVLELTHYSAESYGLNKIYQNVKGELDIPTQFFFDERFA